MPSAVIGITKVEANQVREDGQSLQLEPLIYETIKRFEILNPKFAFVENTEAIKDVILLMNPLHLEQILMIILDNAVKYLSLHKRIIIEGNISNNKVHIVVQDHGIGIPEID